MCACIVYGTSTLHITVLVQAFKNKKFKLKTTHAKTTHAKKLRKHKGQLFCFIPQGPKLYEPSSTFEFRFKYTKLKTLVLVKIFLDPI